MKIRNGFVSNSSSSSFVVLLPENLDEILSKDVVEKAMEDSYSDECYEDIIEDLTDSINQLIDDKVVWQEGNYDVYRILIELLSDYTIHSCDSGPDDGTIEVANKDLIEKILKKL